MQLLYFKDKVNQIPSLCGPGVCLNLKGDHDGLQKLQFSHRAHSETQKFLHKMSGHRLSMQIRHEMICEKYVIFFFLHIMRSLEGSLKSVRNLHSLYIMLIFLQDSVAQKAKDTTGRMFVKKNDYSFKIGSSTCSKTNQSYCFNSSLVFKVLKNKCCL